MIVRSTAKARHPETAAPVRMTFTTSTESRLSYELHSLLPLFLGPRPRNRYVTYLKLHSFLVLLIDLMFKFSMFHGTAGCLYCQSQTTFIIAFPHPFQAISNPASHLATLTSPRMLPLETLAQGLISRVRGRYKRSWKVGRLGSMRLEGLSRSRDLQKMASDRTAGLRIRNSYHFLERCQAGWKGIVTCLYSEQRNWLEWGEETVGIPFEIWTNEVLE